MLRIFVKKWIFLFIILVFDFIIALRTGTEFFYFFFWLLISVIGISLIWVLAEYFGIKLSLERKLAGKIEEDDFLGIEVVIKNKSILPLLSFVLEDYLSCADVKDRQKWILLEYLAARSSLGVRYHCQCPLRGKYQIGPFTVYFFDPLGLFYLKKSYCIYSELYVYPQTFRIQNFPALTKGIAPWFGIETTRVSGDEHEFYGVREYKPGDPIKKIHWLSTARKNQLIVKQFQRLVFFRATILFNLDKDKNFGEGKKSVTEYTVKIAASVAKYLVEIGVSLEIIAHVGEVVHMPFNKGPEHLEDIFRFLSVAQAESRVNMGQLLQEFARHIPNDSTLVVIMLDMDWEFLSALMSLKVKNVSLIPLILISSSFLYASVEERLTRGVQIALPRALDFVPIFFSCGANLEEAFLRF